MRDKFIILFLIFGAFCSALPLQGKANEQLPDNLITDDAVYQYTFTDFDKACLIMKELRKRGNLSPYTLDMTEGDLYYTRGIRIWH